MSDCQASVREAELPHVRFYRLLSAAPLPARAARDALGHLPIRAARYCDAVATASSFGWWLFPPMDFSLLWDGRRILWTWGGRSDWLLLDAAQFPGYAAEFDAAAPHVMRGFSPPFLTALPEPGHVQIWSGFFARSAPGWSLLIRPPANFEPARDVLIYEGIVEADSWFGPVFTNIRLTRQDEPVNFLTSHPFLQVQPVQRQSYTEAAMNSVSFLQDIDGFTSTDWTDYERTIVKRNQTPSDRPGAYAIAARRRRKRDCPASSPARSLAFEPDARH